jgi:hypothetical protein
MVNQRHDAKSGAGFLEMVRHCDEGVEVALPPLADVFVNAGCYPGRGGAGRHSRENSRPSPAQGFAPRFAGLFGGILQMWTKEHTESS